MSGKSLKILVAAIAILLMTVAAMGAVSAATLGNSQVVGYVMNVTYGPLVAWAQQGKIVVALWTYNSSVAKPDPRYCKLIPAVAVDSNALKVIADYYGVNVTDIKYASTSIYGANVTPSNPRYAATNAGYAFDNLLVNSKPLWVAAYVIMPNGTKMGWAYVNITHSGTTIANIVVSGVPTTVPAPPTPTSWLAPYIGANNTVTFTGVLKAIQDWQNGVITFSQVLQVINYWQSGTVV